MKTLRHVALITLLALTAPGWVQGLPKFECSSDWQAKIRKAAPAAAPAKAGPGHKVLIFSLATGYIHWCIPHTEAVIKIIGDKSGAFEAVGTKDIEAFRAKNLATYDAVVLNNVCPQGNDRDVFRDVLINKVDQFGAKYKRMSLAEREALATQLYRNLVDYVADGGGLVALHGGITCFNYSDEFSDLLGGSFKFHPSQQDVTLHPVDPAREDDAVEGPVVKLGSLGYPTPLRPTDEITFDWNRGNLVFDAPGVAQFTGFLAQHGPKVEFENGVVLSDVTIRNDEGIPYPVGEDEQYISFCLTSEDGKPLAETSRAMLSLVSTSFNTGLDVPARKWGSLPVLYARVGGTITAPALDGMRYTLRDWHMREIGKGIVKNATLKISADLPVFTVEMERSQRDVRPEHCHQSQDTTKVAEDEAFNTTAWGDDQ